MKLITYKGILEESLTHEIHALNLYKDLLSIVKVNRLFRRTQGV